MKKLFRNVLIVCLLVLSVVAVGVFAACDNTPKGELVTYTVTVVNENDEAVQGVKVSIGKGTTSYESLATNSEGKATFDLPADEYDVKLTADSIPDGYSAPEDVKVTANAPSATIKLVKKLVYTVKLVNEDGTPFYHDNVYVALCQLEGSCLTPSLLKAGGVWTMEGIPADEYKIQIQLPEGVKDRYTFDGNTADSHYYSGKHVTESEPEVTIVMKKLNTLGLTSEMAPAEKRAFAAGFSMFEANTLPSSFSFTYSFKANETKYFAFEAYKASDYAIFCKQTNTVFTISGEDYEVAGSLAQEYNLKNGETFFFTVTSKAAGNVQFVISGPDGAPDSTELNLSGAGTKEITVVSAEKYATVYFAPSQTGVYEIKSEGAFDTRVEYYANAITMFKTGEDDDGGEGKNFLYGGIECQQVGPTFLFRIFVKDGTFPATFNITITRTGDAQEIVQRETKTVTPEQLGETAYDGTGAYIDINLEEAQTVVRDEDGYYRLGSADGSLIVAKLNQPFRGFGVFTAQQSGGRAANDFYMGFADYASETIFWDYTSFLTAYQAKCNADGVYPVNDELKLMLERWAGSYIRHYFGIEVLGTIANGNEWLIPCGYYLTTELTGSGAPDDKYHLGYGAFDIVLPASSTVYFDLIPGSYTLNIMSRSIEINIDDSITVSEIDGGFTFNCESSRTGLTQFTIDNSGAELTVKITVVPQVKESTNTLVPGKNEVEISAEEYDQGATFTFTPAEDGRYVISSASGDSALIVDGVPASEYGFAVTIDAQAGETYEIILSSTDKNGASYTVVVNKEIDIGENTVTVYDETELYDGTVFGFSPMESGKYKITCTDEITLFALDAFNGYDGDIQVDGFEFVVDCEEFKDYYFAVISNTTGDYKITIEKVTGVED